MSKIKKKVLFGSALCPDCPPAKKLLEEAGIRFLYLDITGDLANLKKFLHLRDNFEAFNSIKENGKIGIPCLSINDGEEIIFDFESLDLDSLKK